MIVLRIDNCDLEALCTWWCVFPDIFAIYESIWASCTSNESLLYNLLNGIIYIIDDNESQNI